MVLLWKILLKDLLNLIPEARAFANDGTVAITYDPDNEHCLVEPLNTRFRDIADWSYRSQVKFAPQKAQLLNITRSDTRLHLQFQGQTLVSQNEDEILGITYDENLTFKTHIENIARNLCPN